MKVRSCTATARRNGSPQRLAATARRNGSPQRLAATARVESSQAAFNASLVSPVLTRASTDVPDQLYNLEIRQYDRNGNHLAGKDYGSAAQSIGAKLDISLQQSDDCQLVVVARGSSNAISTLGTKKLTDVQNMTASSSIISAIDPLSSGGLNAMPYVLHLKHMKVTSDGKLQSIEGSHDARLLLKRLAVKLTVNWSISADMTTDHYALKEVKLCQVPVDFRILPAQESTEWGTTYPSVVSEFSDTYRLTDATELTAGKKTVWIPANVRGSSAKATSSYYRTKENAPDAASYVELVVDNSVKQERLYYRAYLGGKETTDFNLKENTDYNWTLSVNSANYRSDGRIQLLDQTPVVSTNIVNTSNCLMMTPGTNICFNPYKHTSGTNGWNDYLVNNPGASPSAKSAIASVKVLWQSKDAGMTGDLVLGYVIDNSNHQNLVNLTNGGDINQARISVKVPSTDGGNAVIAAYAADGTTILWSWHIWITDYVPVVLEGEINATTRATAISAAQAATRNGAVQVYQGISWIDPAGSFYKSVIMDRNLGAIRAGMQNNALDGVRTFGLLYQGGRKDPFFSTADGTTAEKKTIYDGYGVQTAIARESLTTLNDLVRKPLTFNTNYTIYNASGHWNGGGPKTIYDPCPDGWRVPCNGVTPTTAGSSSVTDATTKTCMTAGFGSTNTSLVYELTVPVFNNVMYYNGTNIVKINKTSPVETSTFVGSGIVYYGINEGPNGDPVFFPGVSLREYNNGNYRATVNNNSVFLWSSTGNAGSDGKQLQIYQIQGNLLSFRHPVAWTYGFSVRCVQDWNR